MGTKPAHTSRKVDCWPIKSDDLTRSGCCQSDVLWYHCPNASCSCRKLLCWFHSGRAWCSSICTNNRNSCCTQHRCPCQQPSHLMLLVWPMFFVHSISCNHMS